MSNEFIVKNGLIVGGNVVTSGTITINGALAATQSWVTSQAYLTSSSLTSYATQTYVNNAVAALVDSAPGALDTLNELAAALGDDASFSTTVTNSIASKQSQLNGTGLVRMSGTSVSYDNTTYLISNFGNIEGDHTYGYPSSNGWYKIAEVVFNGACQSYNLWGEYRDTGYFDNSHYRIHITARAECDFPTNNESHAINVNIYGSSTNETYFSNNVRVVLTSSSSNYRKYELQYYRFTWDTGSWNLQTLGWTTYTTSQTAGTPTGTPRVYYVSKFSTDNIFVANRLSIGTTYAGFAANIAGTTYIIGASVWVNDGYGISNASSGGTGFFPYSDGTLVFNSANSEKMRVASSGNVGINTNSPGYKLEVNGGSTGNNIARFTTGGVGGGTRGLTMYSDNSQVKLQVSDNAGGIGTWAFLNLNPDGGYVGIGITSPTEKLHVNGDTRIVGNTYVGGIINAYQGDASIWVPNLGQAFTVKQTTGNVGIGTTGPETKLHVAGGKITLKGGSSTDQQIVFNYAREYVNGIYNSSGHFRLQDNSLGGTVYEWDGSTFAFPNGNIGIGTTSPASKLQVVGDIRIQNETGLITDYGPLVGRYNTSQVYVGTGGSYSIVKIARADGGALNVLSGGNVGIGTDSPNYKLDVNGGINIYSGNGLRWGSGDAEIINSGYSLLFKTYNGSSLAEAMRINSAGKVSIGTTDTNSDKSDFTVYTGSGASLALVDDQVRMGSTDVNWGVALRSTGTLQTYGQPLNLNTQAGNHAVNIQPNGTTVAQFYQDYSYFPGLDFSISRVNGTHSSNYFRGDGSHLVIGTGGTLYLNYGGSTTIITGNTTNSGWLGVTGIASVGARKLSLGILDLNSGVTPAQYKIKTNIPWNYGGSDFTVNIKGFRYGVGQMVSLSIGWHFYNNEFYNRNAISNGAWAPTISLAKSSDGYVIIYIPGPDYWPKLYIESVYSSNSADSYTSGWSWTDADLSDCTLIQTVPYKALATNISGNAATATSATTAGALSSMNISQFTNNSGYITGYTETDTLASVTGRGATTSTPITVTGTEGREVAVYIPSSYTTDDLVSGHEYGWYSDHWRLGMTRSGGAAGADFVVQWNASRRLSLTSSGNLTATGTITATGGNSSQWNTAYGWGNHASASYATTSYVTTQINNLVNGAPGALDTLNELATALGNDASFSTTVTNSIAGKVSKAGDTMTSSGQQVLNVYHGAATGDFNDALFLKSIASGQQVQIGMATLDADGDHHRVSLRAYKGTQTLEGVFGIALRQPGSAAHTQRLTLDYLGNLTIGGFLTESSSLKLKENVETSEGNLEKVVNLRPVTYNKIGSQTTELGLIAEEVATVYPEFVQYDENGEPVGVNYSRLTAALIGAVKELTNQVQELNKKING